MMSKMSKYNWLIINSAKKLIEDSQKEKFPYFVDPKEVYGLKIQINRHVFSPKYAKGYKFFIPRIPNVKNKTVLEIGCGCGVVSLYLAKKKKAKFVLATDINKYAVENTKINIKLNNLKNVEARVSDVYSNIKDNEKFDFIFWNTPWAKVPHSFKKKMNWEDYGVFDVEYDAISRFILEGKKHLKPKGALLLGFGVEGADVNLIEKLIKVAKLKKTVIADDYFCPGEKVNGKLIKFRMKLYKLE